MSAPIRNSLIAISLGLLPFAVFIGSSSATRLNGRVVQEAHFNVLGLVLATAGLLIIGHTLLSSSRRSAPGLSLAVLAAVVCVGQIGASAGLYSPHKLMDFPPADADLPQLAYKGLDAGNRRIPEGILAKNDPAETRRHIIGYKASALSAAYTHLTYADRCHDGRRRLDPRSLDALPDFVTDAERSTVAAEEATGRKRGTALSCNEANTSFAMGKMVDDANRLQDFVSILLAGYRAPAKTAR